MSSHLVAVWTEEQRQGLRRLAGSRASGIVPIRQALVDLLLRRWKMPSILEDLRIHLLPRRHVHVSASVRVFGFRKQIDAKLTLPPAVDFSARPVLQLRFVERSAFAFAASLAAPIFGRLPAGISLSESAVTIDLQELFSRVGAAEWLPHIQALAFDSDLDVVWVNLALEISSSGRGRATHTEPPASPPRQNVGPAASSDWISLFAGTRLDLGVRADQSLVTESLAAALADASQGQERPASFDGHRMAGFLAPPRIRFEQDTMFLETAIRIDGTPGGGMVT